MTNRLDVGPEVTSAVAGSFATGRGFHALVDGLRLKPKHTDPLTAWTLGRIVSEAPGIIEGLQAVGEYVDPQSVTSGSTPTWLL